jgi:FecR protein/SPOR domain
MKASLFSWRSGLAISASLLTLSVSSFSALAGTPGKVEAVVAPAWLERNGLDQPLTPGIEIRDGDVVKTGTGSRAYLALAEGSRVKLGETARFEFKDSSTPPQGLFRGVFNVAKGAFRFTTGLVGKSRSRDVTIRVATATIGIRGTDVWGRAAPDSELVALIEGKIDLTRAGQSIQLAPMNFMLARQGEMAQVHRFDFAALQALAAETEIAAGAGALSASGKWVLKQNGMTNQGQALDLYDRIRAAGYPATIRPERAAADAGEWQYSIRIAGFATNDEALRVAADLKSAIGAQLTSQQTR